MYPSYPHNGFYYVQPAQSIPRTLLYNVDLDDYLQLQLLLQCEQDRRRRLIEEEYERRRLEEEYRTRLEEHRRLELALRRLQYCHQESQRQRDLTAQQTREEQRERRRLIAQAIAEDEYRRRVAAAVEQRRQAETTKKYREELLRRQHEQKEASKYEEQRREQLGNLLKHVFGHQLELNGEEGEESKRGLKGEERAAWEDYLDAEEPLEEEKKEESQKPQPTIDYKSATSKQTPTRQSSELKDHVVTLQDLLQELLTTVPTPSAFDTQPDSDNTPAAPAHSESTVPALSESTESTVPALSEPAAHAQQVASSLRALSSLEARLAVVQSQHESRVLSRPLSFHSDGRLSPVSDNRGFLEYEHEIMQILLALDGVESFDESIVRENRKALVKRANALLMEIDDYKKREWEKASSVDGEEIRSEVAEENKTEEEKVEPYVIESVEPTSTTDETTVIEKDTKSAEPASTTEETTTTKLDVERDVAETTEAETVESATAIEEAQETAVIEPQVEPSTAIEETQETVVIEPQVTVEPSSENTEISATEADNVESALGEALAEGPDQHAKHHVTVVEVLEGDSIAPEEEEFVVV